MIHTQVYNSPIGELMLGSFEDELVLCDWKYRRMRNTIDARICKELCSQMEEGETAVTKNAKSELDAYFAERLKEFTTPIKLIGTDFQKAVWNALLKIPYGKTISYMELAKKLRNEGAVRAVASANGANALSIFVPCHRVVGSDGSLTGYAGGISAKKKLLQLEDAAIIGQGVLF